MQVLRSIEHYTKNARGTTGSIRVDFRIVFLHRLSGSPQRVFMQIP